MDELGYDVEWQLLNSKYHGVPQNRERVFTISILDGGEFEFPEKQELKIRLKDVLEDEVDEKYYISKAMMDYFMGVNQKPSKFPRKERFLQNIYRKDQSRANSVTTHPGNRPTDNFVIVASRGRGEPTQQQLEPRLDGLTNTITSVQKDNYVGKEHRIRKLTPKECWRLMGFSDDDFNKAQASGVSNSQLYKQAGNSIVVNVLEGILRELLNDN